MVSYTAMDANETFVVAPEESRSFQMVPRVSCSMVFRVEGISVLFVGSEGGEGNQNKPVGTPLKQSNLNVPASMPPRSDQFHVFFVDPLF